MSLSPTRHISQTDEQTLLQQAVEVIRTVAEEHGVDLEHIYLFGSRARGEADSQSDWDFYVVTRSYLDGVQRRAMVTEIKRLLARLGIPNDVLLESEERFQRFSSCVGHLAREVAQEGVRLL